MPTTGSTSTGYAHFIILVIICSSSMVSTLVTNVITWIITHLQTPKGWKAELAWLVNP